MNLVPIGLFRRAIAYAFAYLARQDHLGYHKNPRRNHYDQNFQVPFRRGSLQHRGQPRDVLREAPVVSPASSPAFCFDFRVVRGAVLGTRRGGQLDKPQLGKIMLNTTMVA